MTGSATNHLTNRRGFLKIAAAGTAAALSRPLPAGAAEKTFTILHESSFIKPFDEYVANTLAPAYEKETGIKVVYEVTSVGNLPTRISTIAETGSGADITMNGLLQVVRAATNISTSATSPTRSARRKAAGTTPARRPLSSRANGRRSPSPISVN